MPSFKSFMNLDKKITPNISGLFFYSKKSLCLFGSANGANAFARAAFETSVSVDFVNAVIFCNCANGASICASTATEASLFVNLICHNRNSVLDGNKICYTKAFSRRRMPLHIYSITFFRKVKYIMQIFSKRIKICSYFLFFSCFSG